MAGDESGKQSSTRQLGWLQVCLLRLLAGILGVWSRTLRFRWEPEVQAFIDGTHPPSIILLWHNRLFAVPVFYRRYFSRRRQAVLISSSKDGAWLASFLQLVGMHPVRGSRYNRGSQAVRELIAAIHDGYDVGITPDGSRGPMYDMKPGAVALAVKTGAPIVLLAFNYRTAWRLNSWDRFYLPLPFSTVEVRVDRVDRLEDVRSAAGQDATEVLKARMQRIATDRDTNGVA
jgi:lysophospholipid acyltransferase (LPLAT)-like uncharacterized protein